MAQEGARLKLRQLTVRTISPLGLGRRGEHSARQAKGTRTKREVWARRSVYQLLVRLFRTQSPFCQNRPLTQAEFIAVQEQYSMQRRRRRDPSASSKVGRDLSKVFPFFHHSTVSGDWKAHEFIGKAMFASKHERQRLREQAIKEKTFISGPLQRRKFLAAAWRALPQAKNRYPLEVLRIAAYRRGSEFLWAFLTGEHRAGIDADTLAQEYPWLALTADKIRAGLAHPDKQPDLDTAAEFHISPSYVRRLL